MATKTDRDKAAAGPRGGAAARTARSPGAAAMPACSPAPRWPAPRSASPPMSAASCSSRCSAGAAGDWLDALKAEHKAALAMFDKIEATGDEPER